MEEAQSDVETRKDDESVPPWPSGDELDSRSLTAAFVKDSQHSLALDPDIAESGILARLVRGCLDLFATLTEESGRLSSLQRRDQNIIKRSHGTLRLWVDSHGVFEGKLDHALERSKGLRDTTLLTLNSLCGTLLICSRKLGPHDSSHTSTAIQEAQTLYDQTRYVLASSDEDSSDSDVDSDSSTEELNDELRSHLVGEIKTYINCLVDLDTALECPAIDPEHADEPVIPRLEERSAYEYYAELVLSKFPEVGPELAECLGKANWDRYKRLKDIRERNESPPVALPFVSEIKSTASKSFKDSGLGTTTYAQSVVSIISYVSSLSNGERVKIPPLPAEAKNGERFECNACGDLIVATTNRAWRKHIFNDLQPYTCFYSDCSFSAVPFMDRNLWIDHLDIEHKFGPDWQSRECPLCFELTGSGKSTNLVHFSRHMEEIALASLPRGVDSETNSEAGTSSVSDANSVPDVDAANPQVDTPKVFSSSVDNQEPESISNLGDSVHWTEHEVNDFDQLVAHFGTDWESIAKHMGTKSPVMVEDQYQRLMGSTAGAYLARLSEAANSTRDTYGFRDHPPILNQTPGTLQRLLRAAYRRKHENQPEMPENSPFLQSMDSPSSDRILETWNILAQDQIKSAVSLETPLDAVATETDDLHNLVNKARTHTLYNSRPMGDGCFHCPWEGQPNCNHNPTDTKHNYDKYVDSHLKPYRCTHCTDVQFSSTADLLRHERESHGLHGQGSSPHLCHFPTCERSLEGNGFRRRYNLFDHMKRVHDHPGSDFATASSVSAARDEALGTDSMDHQASTAAHIVETSTHALPGKHIIFIRPFSGDLGHKSPVKMKLNILPHDTADSIITTVKNFYGINDREGVFFEDGHGSMLIPSYQNLAHDMVVHVQCTGEARPENISKARQSNSQTENTPSERLGESQKSRDTTAEGERTIPAEDLPALHLKAMFDYQSYDKTCLSFRKGEHIRVITQGKLGWWYGAISDRQGWFPSSYCDQVNFLPHQRAVACTICKMAKTKCDKALPSCSRCTAKGLVCEPGSVRITSDGSHRTPTEPSIVPSQPVISREISSPYPKPHNPYARMSERRAITCTICAKAKTKCDKAVPSCSRCTAKGLICEPRSTRRTNDSSYRKPTKHLVSFKKFPTTKPIPSDDNSPNKVDRIESPLQPWPFRDSLPQSRDQHVPANNSSHGGLPTPMGQGQPLEPQSLLASAQTLLQANPSIIQHSDNSAFPPGVLNENENVRQHVPVNVKTWLQLKMWAQANASTHPGLDNRKLVLLQVLNYYDTVRMHSQIQQQQQHAQGLSDHYAQHKNTRDNNSPPSMLPPLIPSKGNLDENTHSAPSSQSALNVMNEKMNESMSTSWVKHEAQGYEAREEATRNSSDTNKPSLTQPSTVEATRKQTHVERDSKPVIQGKATFAHDTYSGSQNNEPRDVTPLKEGVYQRSNWLETVQMPPDFHDLPDYQQQLWLLEQKNKRRVAMTREEQDRMDNNGTLRDTRPTSLRLQTDLSNSPDRTGKLNDTTNTSPLTSLLSQNLAQDGSLDSEHQGKGPQQPPNLPNVTPQEIQSIRMKLPPQSINASDEQLYYLIIQQKISQRKQQLAQQKKDGLTMTNQFSREDDQIQALLREQQGKKITYFPPLNEEKSSSNNASQEPQVQSGELDQQSRERTHAAQQKEGTHNSHPMQDYETQVMLLEQHNKRRLMMAREEQERERAASLRSPPHTGNASGTKTTLPSTSDAWRATEEAFALNVDLAEDMTRSASSYSASP